jgi:hypothetical protein
MCTDSCCDPEPGITYVPLSSRLVKATRKAHDCCTCHGEIPAGSPACVTAALIDGEFWAGHEHYPGCPGEEY